MRYTCGIGAFDREEFPEAEARELELMFNNQNHK